MPFIIFIMNLRNDSVAFEQGCDVTSCAIRNHSNDIKLG